MTTGWKRPRRGWTRTEDTEAYADYILGTGIEEYKATPGNRGRTS
jgi:hypothetical protein